MDCNHRLAVLFNGQGDYCEEWQGDAVPPGCFIQLADPRQMELLKNHKARMRADGTLDMRR